MLRLAREVPFRDNSRAMAYLASFGAGLPERVQERLRVLLKNSADPDSALHNLCRLHEEQPGAFHRVARSHAALQFLLAVFSHSEFLAGQLLKTPEWIEPLPMAGDLHRVLSAEECTERLEQRLRGAGVLVPGPEDLAQFRREQILRILLRDLLGYAALADVTEELSNLADSILEGTYRRIRAFLELRHGVPQLPDGCRCGYSVLSLGKLGGRELNYSSDIDLMFVYEGNGETSGPDSISNKEFFKKLSTQLTDLLSKHTSQGMCYRVDLRLRPEGTLGEVCISQEGAEAYYQRRARDWELQMLIKARVAAGERDPGRRLLQFVEPLIYSTTLDFSKIEAMSESRERIHEKLARKRNRKTEFDVKLEPGGIRDIEFLVQCLQRLHGGREPWVRHGGTLLALFRLRDKNLLSEIEYSRLAAAYQFLRTLEHRLQVAQDRQTHTLPPSAEELDLLERRMPPAQLGGPGSRDTLLGQIQRHLDAVREIYDRVIHANLPAQYMQEPVAEMDGDSMLDLAASATALFAPDALAAVDPAASNLVRGTLSQRAPGLAATLSRTPIQRGLRQFEYFIESILPNPEWLRWLDEDPVLAGFVIDLFEHSPYFAEQLNRKPELIEELRQLRLKPAAQTRYGEMPRLLAEPAGLRRFYSREILRIECESICLRRPIFPTLKHTSDLADCVIATAYKMAVEQVLHSQGPAARRYQPKDQLIVVALGRLGMQEFDLGSDADLVFVLTDTDFDEHLFWTRVAERMVDVITSYTGEGVMFAVDTRLRPNGREGPLVQSEGAFKEYFARTAEAWEGIAYMKARAVAGNVERGTEFLSELQDLDWRRYGQGGRSKEKLRQLRQRLEAELGPSNPLKAGRGGYFDIDFALMYLRLRSAGIFFKVLNTPLRIEVIEKMGHLDRADAAFLLDAATFYRAVDHGMRLTAGHAEGRLPSAQIQLEMLTELVGRWTPDHLHDQPLPLELAQIQERTRESFDRLFG